MNVTDIIDDYDDDNIEDLERAADYFLDRNSASLDHITAATTTVRICIDVVIGARLDNGSMSGRILDRVLEQLLEIEGDLSRATGELLGADPH